VHDDNIEPFHPAATAFYRERGLSHSTVHRFGLGRVRSGRYAGRLEIPYEDGCYRVRSRRYRALGETSPKFLNPANQKLHLFAVRAADEAIGYICEGEIDAMTAWQCGVKASGLPGANVWQDEWSYLWRNAERVVLALDSDEAGRRGAHRIARSLKRIGIEVEYADLPEGKDVNDILIEHGAAAVREVLRA
jgi:DNA primase